MTLDEAAFAGLMAPLGPFERQPRLAVAVSGGADSLALTLLADRWARAQGGEAIGLTVDHGLRADSAEEARQVGVWLAARGIHHQALRWFEAQGGPGLQAAAREARYRLLNQWCRDHFILHLLLGHHRDDQAETLMLRLGRGSGVDGLAAMSASSGHSDLQHLRPLLDVPRQALRDFLQREGQGWIEDPSNDADRFERVRWRKFLAEDQIDAERLALTARQLGRARQALEGDCALLAVEAVQITATGHALLDPVPLIRAPDEIALRLLAALSRTIGGGVFPPRFEPLERVLGALRGGLTKRRTFAGCVFVPKDDAVLVQREVAKMAEPVPVAAGRDIFWDNRFSVRLAKGEGLTLGALGEFAAPRFREQAEQRGIPRSVLPTLPAIMDKHGILAVPPLGWTDAESGLTIERWGFTPVFPLAGAGFRLVTAPARII